MSEHGVGIPAAIRGHFARRWLLYLIPVIGTVGGAQDDGIGAAASAAAAIIAVA